jgi:hypothetical protein
VPWDEEDRQKAERETRGGRARPKARDAGRGRRVGCLTHYVAPPRTEDAPKRRHVTGKASFAATVRMTASGVAFAPPVFAYIVVPEPHPHLPAKHDDPVILGTEIGVVFVVLFVGFKLVAWRLLRLS